MVWDFSSAHRVAQVHPDDWGLQARTFADLRNKAPDDNVEVCVNIVGAFGFSTAGHWWLGRGGGAMLCMLAITCWVPSSPAGSCSSPMMGRPPSPWSIFDGQCLRCLPCTSPSAWT